METEHSRAQLYAGSAEEAQVARQIEEAIAGDRAYLGQELANKLNDIAFDRIYSPGRQDDMIWIINQLDMLSDFDSRRIVQMLRKMHKEMAETQADVDTSTQALIEEMENL